MCTNHENRCIAINLKTAFYSIAGAVALLGSAGTAAAGAITMWGMAGAQLVMPLCPYDRRNWSDWD